MTVADDPTGSDAFRHNVRVPSGAGSYEQEAGEAVLSGKEGLLPRVVLLGQAGKQAVRIGRMHLARSVSDNRTEAARITAFDRQFRKSSLSDRSIIADKCETRGPKEEKTFCRL